VYLLRSLRVACVTYSSAAIAPTSSRPWGRWAGNSCRCRCRARRRPCC
jgi:hypothetical protein